VKSVGRMGRMRRMRRNNPLQLSKKCLNSIHFSPKKASQSLTHNLSIMPKFYVKKDVYKAEPKKEED